MRCGAKAEESRGSHYCSFIVRVFYGLFVRQVLLSWKVAHRVEPFKTSKKKWRNGTFKFGPPVSGSVPLLSIVTI